MTALTTQRYAYEANHDGTYSILDTVTGECVGTSPDEPDAVKAVQRLSALWLANDTRIRRAAIKREIRSASPSVLSRETCAAVFEDNPPVLASMRVESLLLCVRSLQKARTDACLVYAGCSTVRLVGELTTRQRVRLVDALRMSPDELSVEVSGIRQAMRRAVAS